MDELTQALKRQYLEKLMTPIEAPRFQTKEVGIEDKFGALSRSLGNIKVDEKKDFLSNLTENLKNFSDPLKEVYQKKLEYEQSPEFLQKRLNEIKDPVEGFFAAKDLERAKAARAAQMQGYEKKLSERDKAIADYLKQQADYDKDIAIAYIGSEPDREKLALEIAKGSKLRGQDIPDFVKKYAKNQDPKLMKKGGILGFGSEVALAPKNFEKMKRFENVMPARKTSYIAEK